MNLIDRLKTAYSSFLNPVKPNDSVVGAGNNVNEDIYKAIIPNFLYKPPFGYPLAKDIPEIRRMAKSPYVCMITNTICDEVASLEWNIVCNEKDNIPEDIITKTYDFFYNPNKNNESFEQFERTLIRDILEIDAGVIVKVRNLKDELVELYVRDGGTFLKNPNEYGVMPEYNAYFQYGWTSGARPIPFNSNEIVYFMRNPNSSSIYGLSPVEVLYKTLLMLTYGIESNLEYFTDNNIPKGVFEMIGANKDSVDSFSKLWSDNLKKKDEVGNLRRYFHKMPIINTEGKFTRISFSNAELELIRQQEWFTKIVFACFGITPSELGFTQDSNRATEIIQSNVFKRKTINPLIKLLEYNFNTQIINDLPWIKGKYENKVKFEYVKYDQEEEYNKRIIMWNDLKNGLKTANELREELDLVPIEGGDKLRTSSSNFSQFGNNNFNQEDVGNIQQDKKKSLITEEKAKVEPEEPFEKELVKQISDIEKEIIAILDRNKGIDVIKNLKAIDNEFINNLVKLFTFKGIKDLTTQFIKSHFIKGLEKVEEETNKNYLPNQDALKFLDTYTFDNIQGMTDEIQNDLRQELQRAILNGESVEEMKKRVKEVMKVADNRARLIARTELNRAENMGNLDGWRQSGLDMEKEWVAELDGRTSEACKYLDGKKVGINEKFIYKGQEYDSPPQHPNCRSTLIFTRKTSD
jgi:SPP1 gp7 family putative phage head morphogenesis protein